MTLQWCLKLINPFSFLLTFFLIFVVHSCIYLGGPDIFAVSHLTIIGIGLRIRSEKPRLKQGSSLCFLYKAWVLECRQQKEDLIQHPETGDHKEDVGVVNRYKKAVIRKVLRIELLGNTKSR